MKVSLEKIKFFLFDDRSFEGVSLFDVICANVFVVLIFSPFIVIKFFKIWIWS